MIGAGILGIIVSKLYYKKNSCLIILFEVNKGSKVGFYHIILPLSLAAYLRVEGSGKFLLNV